MFDESGDMLVTRRSRRSTAGNRMAAALAEITLDDLQKDAEDDKDFVAGKEEEDIFESDFESTDEEAPQIEGEATGEQAVQEEEKRARKAVRSRLEKATAAAHARQQATFNPQASYSSHPKKPKAKVNRRVSLGIAVDAETGEVLPVERRLIGGTRQSKRRHTILNTSATVTRLKISEEKRAAAPRKHKIEARTYTQDELIARALDNEEGNIVEHRNYLQMEEEKRKRAQVIRTTISGPLVRWISKAEETKVSVVVETPANQTPLAPTPSFVYSYATMPGFISGTTQYGQVTHPNPYIQAYQINQAMASASGNTAPSGSTQMPTFTFTHPYYPTMPSTVPPQTVERTEKVTKNYVVHELGQYEGVPKPQWADTMESMFGDHVKWDELKVYAGKTRPLARVTHKCPITGKPAKYLDPRTGVPIADVRAFEILTGILKHEYIWDSSLGCYVGHQPLSNNDGSTKSTDDNHRAMDVS